MNNFLVPQSNETEFKMCSQEIAKLTGKRHYNVMRDIEQALSEAGLGALKFEGTYQDVQGKTHKCYWLNRTCVMLLLVKYDAKSVLAVMQWLENSEQQAQYASMLPADFPDPSNTPEMLRYLAHQMEAKDQAILQLEDKRAEIEELQGEVEELEGELEEARPAVKAIEQIVASDAEYDRKATASILGMTMSELSKYLIDEGYCYYQERWITSYGKRKKRRDLRAKAQYKQTRLRKGYFNERIYNWGNKPDDNSWTLIVTAYGLTRLAKKLGLDTSQLPLR